MVLAIRRTAQYNKKIILNSGRIFLLSGKRDPERRIRHDPGQYGTKQKKHPLFWPIYTLLYGFSPLMLILAGFSVYRNCLEKEYDRLVEKTLLAYSRSQQDETAVYR